MAKFELKFIDFYDENHNIQVNICPPEEYEIDVPDLINITGFYDGSDFSIFLDKSTAIKFAKTLRTEINKITESEVNNE